MCEVGFFLRYHGNWVVRRMQEQKASVPTNTRVEREEIARERGKESEREWERTAMKNAVLFIWPLLRLWNATFGTLTSGENATKNGRGGGGLFLYLTTSETLKRQFWGLKERTATKNGGRFFLSGHFWGFFKTPLLGPLLKQRTATKGVIWCI